MRSPEPIAAQLRRRRDAAQRSLPLETGFRDPLDDLEPIEGRGARYKAAQRPAGYRPTAAQVRDIVQVVPKSKPSTGARREGGLMVVHAWDDRSRNLVLIRGNKGVRMLLDEAGAGDVARWSTSGRGWVLPGETAAEVLALAQSWRGCIVKLHRVER